jgi:hypothetical protein
VARYGQALKEHIVARLLPLESASIEYVSHETGVRAVTLERWRAEAAARIATIGSQPLAIPARYQMKEFQLSGPQYRLLQRITKEGLSHKALQRSQGYGVGGQIRTLRILRSMGLVTETWRENEILFELTDAGRELLRSQD